MCAKVDSSEADYLSEREKRPSRKAKHEHGDGGPDHAAAI
jgi:hypothetical protein